MVDYATKAAPGALILRTPALPYVESFLASLPSPHTRRGYRRAIVELTRYADERPLTRRILAAWRDSMKEQAAATVNLRLSAVRALVKDARRTNLITGDEATALLEVKSLPRRGARMGNWLTLAEAKQLLEIPDRKTLRGKRNYCILAVLLGCALRRYELSGLNLDKLQKREGRWVLADIEGKGGRTRTVAVPVFAKQAIDEWTKEAGIKEGRLIRGLSCDPAGLSEYRVWEIVQWHAEKIGVSNFGPHDLRRTCAKLCRKRGGQLEQIQAMLGHESIETTRRYLGSEQELEIAVNDNLGL